jgi:DNA-binding beta-propeller fold protein YncE
MSLRRVGWVAAIALAALFDLSCGQVYRPVVIPINIVPPNTANFHAVFGISTNVSFNPGTALQIDVSGDTDIGQANMGINPTHAAILPNNSRVFVANAGANLCGGGTDVVTAFFPAADVSTATGLGTTTTFSLPNVATIQPSPVTINAISEVGNLVTVNLTAPLPNATVGSQVVIQNVVIPATPPLPPNLEYNGCFKIVTLNGATFQYVNPNAALPALLTVPGGTATLPTFCPYLPDYVATSQTNAVYAANYGAEGDPNCNLSSTDSVVALNPGTNTISNLVYLPPNSHPVAMVETPDAQNLYVLNQGSNSVFNLSPTDLSTYAPIPVGNLPTWAVSRPDGRRVYVVTQGDGMLYTIDTVANALIPQPPQSVGGAGANFVLYDKSRNRLYVTNPTAGEFFVFDATTDPPTPLCALSSQGIACPAGSPTGIPIPAPQIVAPLSTVCATSTCSYSAPMPASVAALPDGSRFYVASYVLGTATSSSDCPDTTVTVAPTGCIIPQVTVFDAASLTVKTNIFPVLPPVTTTSETTTTTTTTTYPFAVARVTFCDSATPYTPATARFRMSAVAAPDSSRVYSSVCDGGLVAIVNTTTSTVAAGGTNTPDTLVTDLPAPVGAGPPQSNQQPLPQTPVFLLTGQ